MAEEWLESPTTCPVHTVPQAGAISVFVCTHPAHEGRRPLANIPGFGQTGGCPAEYVISRYFLIHNTPTQRCTIAEHAVTGFGGGTNEWGQGESSGDNNQQINNQFPGGSDNVLPPSGSNQVGRPVTPTGVSVGAFGGNSIVSWHSGNDLRTTVYIVERVTNGDPATRIRFPPVVAGTSFEDFGVLSGNTYTYRVYAFNTENPDPYRVSDWSASVIFNAD
jgi:penicillin-binding protein 1A